MIRNLLFRMWRSHLLFIAGWAGFCILIVIYNISLYSYFASTPDYSQYLNNMPLFLRFFVGHPSQPGPFSFLALTTLILTAPLIWLILVVRIGINETAGEEEAGMLEFLLIQPIPRWKLFVIKVFGMASTVTMMGFLFWLSLLVTNVLAKMELPMNILTLITLAMGFFVFWSGTLTMLFGAIFGRGDITAFFVSLLMLIFWIGDGFARTGLVSQNMRWFNPYGMMIMNTIEKNAITPLAGGIMAVLIIGTIVGGIAVWQRRNFYGRY